MTLVFDSNDGAHKTNIQATETSFLLSLYFLLLYPKQSLDLDDKLQHLQQHTKIQTSIHYIRSPRKMKSFSSTTIFLAAAFASSVSANNQCLNNLPSTTSAH